MLMKTGLTDFDMSHSASHQSDSFWDLLDRKVDCEKTAEAVADSLVFLSPQMPCTDSLMKISRRLEQLNKEYPNSISIASDYAEGLFWLAEELKSLGSVCIYTETIEKLKGLAEKYPCVESVTGWLFA